MENAVDALIMAGSVLLLIIALTVSISSFTSLKTQVEDIISEREETDLVTDDEGNYLNYIEGADDIRTVGLETVISAARRVRRESYTVYICGLNWNSGILDSAEREALDPYLDDAIRDQKYGSETIVSSGEKILTIGVSSLTDEAFAALRKLIKCDTTDTTDDIKFKEYLGIYQENNAASSANRATYRIVTYVAI